MPSVSHQTINIAARTLENAFPKVEPMIMPLGSMILTQIRSVKRKTDGGVILTNDALETEKWNTQVAKVIALGPLAFRDRTTMEFWPEGAWCGPGDYIRTPKYGGDKWEVPVPGSDDPALFVLFRDIDILGRVTGDPLRIRAFV